MSSETVNELRFIVEDTISGIYSGKLSVQHVNLIQPNSSHQKAENNSVINVVDDPSAIEEEKNNENTEKEDKTETSEDVENEEDIEVVDPNLEIIENAAATGEDPVNEGGEGVSHPHDPDEADVFDKDYDLDFGSAPPLVFVFLDDELINEFYQETVAEDAYLTSQSNGSPISTGADTFHSVGNTLLDISNNMVQNFNRISPFQFQPQLISLLDDANNYQDSFDVPAVHIIGSVLENDQGLGLMVTGLKNVTEGAFVQMETDGTFKYVPPPGYSDTTDSFEYVVQDLNGNITTGEVNIVLNDTVWYVDNTDIKTGNLGTGTSLDPFTSLNIFWGEDRPDSPNDTIYIRSGVGTYQSGDERQELQLLIGQKLVGEGAALIINDILIWDQGITPNLESNDFLKLADLSGINLIPNSTTIMPPDFTEPNIEFV